jgi:hypothetical protein
MAARLSLGSAVRWAATGGFLAAASYAGYAGVTWLGYGRVKPLSGNEDADPLLDRFMPAYEVVERHKIRVGAPVAVALAAACDLDLQRSSVIRALFRTREIMLGSTRQNTEVPRTLLAMVKAIGWNVLAEIPGREVVVGTVTQPWAADVVFHAIPAGEFAGFHEPGWVKIVWTLRADPISAYESVARTETRVATTDPIAREKFRRYWALVSPGIPLIRRTALRIVKREAERRVSA